MPAALVMQIRMAGDPLLRHHPGDERSHRHEADGPDVRDTRALDDRRQPERHVGRAGQQRDAHADEQVETRRAQRIGEGLVFGTGRLRPVRVQVAFNQAAFLASQPLCCRGGVPEIEVDDDREQQRRCAFDEEQPLPSFEAVPAIHGVHDQARQRSADHAGERNGRHEHRGEACAPGNRHPVGQIEQHPRKEPGFRRAEQKTREVVGVWARHRGQQPGADRPQDHDPQQRLSEPDSREHQVAGNLEDHVACVEHAGSDPEHRVREPEVAHEAELGEANVRAIDVGDDVDDHQHRQETQQHLSV